MILFRAGATPGPLAWPPPPWYSGFRTPTEEKPMTYIETHIDRLSMSLLSESHRDFLAYPVRGSYLFLGSSCFPLP